MVFKKTTFLIKVFFRWSTCKKTEQDPVFWIRFSSSGIVNYSEMPIPSLETL